MAELKSALARAGDVAFAGIEAGVRMKAQFADTPIADAMLHAVRGGKTLRGFLVLQGAALHGVDEDRAKPVAAAIECIHAYSLVHDDLPSMDDDDLRRGQPTVHRKWDEATAVLAGDALQALAFQMITFAEIEAAHKVTLIASLADRAGINGMVGGQALDIAAETAIEPFDLRQIERLQAGKTGALIEWAAGAGAMMVGADDRPLRTYGRALGQAFQIADDILDVTGDEATVGKAVGKDENAGKATFVSLLGLDGAKRRADELVESACDALSNYGDDAETLKEAARFVVNRTH
ncbi:farnesyl diphosphate synthase [Octadecabacter temperatus]|jgi:farnesyl diphosphate synthase|uniref:Geranylgeranyl diphosphate synthase n=1 Tax=Octadecabacter temperatus TaxID=1458307 RepID=A0A0K0Y9K3_9RHOB|nr:farnesyl diphosphate synthase [Octadecabacter temperatus]AKS47634.1 Farnesyl diphosphate synthase [Octadecabacter temperatus]SIO40426.1 farnesyl diphosphate synthase [Octadecabacter temperatus]